MGHSWGRWGRTWRVCDLGLKKMDYRIFKNPSLSKVHLSGTFIYNRSSLSRLLIWTSFLSYLTKSLNKDWLHIPNAWLRISQSTQLAASRCFGPLKTFASSIVPKLTIFKVWKQTWKTFWMWKGVDTYFYLQLLKESLWEKSLTGA